MLSLPVQLTDEALLQLTEIPGKKNYQEVTRALRALENMNEAFGAYDPGYDAARPPFSCRVCYAGDYGIYYVANEAAVTVFSIVDNRLDPEKRFSEIDDIDQLESLLFDELSD
ncbi:MAG: hypothetical protein IJ131_02860 [Eggerthellaceae bacterium]|nr:hypothetical protein [Eggerthellaceae bacterium]